MLDRTQSLATWKRASGTQVNWNKSKALVIGDTDLEGLPEGMEVLRRGQIYKYLGIPVGVEIADDIKTFWADMIEDLEAKVTRWLGLRMSQRARVRVAQTMLMSVPRYGIFYLSLNRGIQKKFEQLQQKLAGGLNLQDVRQIVRASAIQWVARMERQPNLPWVQLATHLMARDTRSEGVNLTKVTTPWKRVLNVQKQNVARTPSLRHIWDTWWECLEYPGRFDQAPISFVMPRTANEVLNTTFWYFPRLFEGGNLQTRGTATWSTDTWKEIADGAFGDIDRVGDILDPVTMEPKMPEGLQGQERRRIARTLRTLIGGLPRAWTQLVETAPIHERQNWTRTRKAFQHCQMSSARADGTEVGRKLDALYYPWVYKALIRHERGDCTLDDRIEGIVLTMSRALRRAVRASEIWNAVLKRNRLPKTNDLLYRLLLDKVLTGAKLLWTGEEGVDTCPLDGHEQTITHLWIECDIAKAVWQEMREIHLSATRSRRRGPYNAPIPTTREELLGFMAIGPPGLTNRHDKARWHTLYSEAVWQIWKLYLNNQFREENFTARGAVQVYRGAIQTRIMMDRALIFNPVRSDFRAKNRAGFTKVWGQSVDRIL
ncbi:uncharacterized protein PV07_12496 [Cladophialophora immunda]|uniref:Reverse transcriptase zinc-binding domain-containing protein n=1 Tax=Cladophialophora immunda TaxID=569365 RepID=A0A0D2CF38_9EURO|nr:uncharacterized protein PV07_12496 [Cladophialophora immunda]KIW22179.1 hypothetical protein PV07_12496 [Cladophialophora immunda]